MKCEHGKEVIVIFQQNGKYIEGFWSSFSAEKVAIGTSAVLLFP